MDDSGMRALFGKVKLLPLHPLPVVNGDFGLVWDPIRRSVAQ